MPQTTLFKQSRIISDFPALTATFGMALFQQLDINA